MMTVSTRQLCYLLFLCSVTLLSACNDLVDQENETTRFSGQIINAVDFMSEIVTPDTTFLLDHTETDAIELSTNALKKAGEYEFTHGQKSFLIYLKPGTSLSIEVDYNIFDRSMRFEGETAIHNRYLQIKQLTDQQYPDDNELFLMNISEFLTAVQEQYEAQVAILNAIKDSINDDAFYTKTMGNLEYRWANKLMNYDHMHGMLTAGVSSEASDTIALLLNNVPIERPELLNSFRYINFVFNKITLKVNEQMATKTFPAYMAEYEMLKSSLALSTTLLQDSSLRKQINLELLSHYENHISTEQKAELMQQYDITIP
ncbi:MAG: hypothetical protein AAFO69_02445 [Bacteroidota bacterium]